MKKSIALIIMISVVFSTISVLFNKSYAATTPTKSMVGASSAEPTAYDFHPSDVLVWAAHVGTSTERLSSQNSDQWPFFSTEVTKEALENKTLIPLNGGGLEGDTVSDNMMDASDATFLLHIAANAASVEEIFVDSIAEKLAISKSAIQYNSYLNLPDDNELVLNKNIKGNNNDEWKEIDLEFLTKVFNYAKKSSISGKYADVVGWTGRPVVESLTAEEFDEVYNARRAGGSDDYPDLDDITPEVDGVACSVENFKNLPESKQNEYRDRYAMYSMCFGDIDFTTKTGERCTANWTGDYDFYTIRAEAKISDGSVYRLVVGTGVVDNVDYEFNWMMQRVKGPDNTTPTSTFATTMDYSSNPAGELSTDGTYYPPCRENDKNVKDSDVVVTIKSETEETIAKTNGHSVSTTPNEDGWYYPDASNKKVIAKDYPFDTYDNTTYNGIVKETVNLTGADGGTSTETPSIKWTFRRKVVEKTENTDKSTTVTITYNLPIDTAKIPDGWSAVYDSDGKTAHKITRTFKSTETYDKDVPVKQNGTDEIVITHITVKAAPTVIVQAGQSMAIVGIIIAVAFIAIERYRKLRKS